MRIPNKTKKKTQREPADWVEAVGDQTQTQEAAHESQGQKAFQDL